MTPTRYVTIASVLCTMLVGCGSVATVHLDTGGRVDGPIVASDAQTVTVDDATLRNGPSLRDPAQQVDGLAIQRGTIADIDHPGTVMMVTGGALTLGGLTMTILAEIASEPGNLRQPRGEEPVAEATSGGSGELYLTGLLTTAVGVGFIWLGADTWLDSKAAAESGLSVQVGPTGAAISGVF